LLDCKNVKGKFVGIIRRDGPVALYYVEAYGPEGSVVSVPDVTCTNTTKNGVWGEKCVFSNGTDETFRPFLYSGVNLLTNGVAS